MLPGLLTQLGIPVDAVGIIAQVGQYPVGGRHGEVDESGGESGGLVRGATGLAQGMASAASVPVWAVYATAGAAVLVVLAALVLLASLRLLRHRSRANDAFQ